MWSTLQIVDMLNNVKRREGQSKDYASHIFEVLEDQYGKGPISEEN